ncbi:MAG: hypothetical protein LBN30_04340 [Oscillospiraceae bacterium]|jgi:hypothetical protein|nr:hypothetical protein [Oscillospiraceae bacterium]
MAIREFSGDLNIISALADEPNDVDGLSAGELKARFDAGSNALKDYINGTLIPDVGDALEETINDAFMASGNMPTGGAAGSLLVKTGADNFAAQFVPLAEVVSAATTPVSAAAKNKLALSGGSAEEAVTALTDRTGILRGTCDTQAATAAKVVAITGFSRVMGSTVRVTFAQGNTAAAPTLNVSGTGAAAITYNGTAVPADALAVGQTALLEFVGSSWELLNPAAAAYAPKLRTGTLTLAANTPQTLTLGFRPALMTLAHAGNFSSGQGLSPANALITGDIGSGTAYLVTSYPSTPVVESRGKLVYQLLTAGISLSADQAMTLYYVAIGGN